VISTGVESLDSRLGPLKAGGIYVFLGPPAAGKSLLALHFLLDGLSRGERCVMVTRDEPAMVDSRAVYLGYNPRRLTEHPGLRIVRLPEPLAAGLTMPPGEALAQWLSRSVEPERPSRIVLDGIDTLADYARAPSQVEHEVTNFLQRLGATAYVLLRDSVDHAAIMAGAAGAFRLDVSEGGERRFSFQVPPAGAFRTDAFPYSLRVGGGFTEDMAMAAAELTPEERRRVMVLDDIGVLVPEVLARLEQMYDLTVMTSSSGALRELSAGRYGALVLAVDPFDEARAFDLVFALRREGIAAPIICVAPSRGLRSTTRSKGLRIGADDFSVADLPPAELVERIHMAWLRGTHRRTGPSQIGQILQPVNGDGTVRPMTRPEFLQAMGTLVAEQPPLFFCYLEFALEGGSTAQVWPSLRGRVRIGDGDIIGALHERRFACALDRITPEQTMRVIERIRSAHPVLAGMNDIMIIPSPGETDRIRERLAGWVAAGNGDGTSESASTHIRLGPQAVPGAS
jgi:KaiC/GvpD/RAD55 family RecA-like ATPase